EKTLKDMGDKVKEEDKKAIEEKIKAVKDILETGSKEDLEAKTSELSDVTQKVGASMYQGQQSQPGEGAEGAQPGADQATAEEKPGEKKNGKVEEGQVVQ
ncbi:Hsp70 family protein, partial [Patescibacteria group bacterium]|nr:Hsp70 family protein [Patescibacteria group bacterium]